MTRPDGMRQTSGMAEQESVMEIIVAKTAGFCFGVERAVNMVYDQLKTAGGPVYTYGPVIHNETVTGEIRAMGGTELPEDLTRLPERGTVVIRSHGAGPDVYEALRRKGLTVSDATCPFVLKIHKIVREASEAGRTVLIAGNADHPEVKATLAWCAGPAYVIGNADEVLPVLQKAGETAVLVAQTTFSMKKFQDIVEIIPKSGYDINVVNTICNATRERQAEARSLARTADVMIVIGGRHSSNTQKLAEICRSACPRTCFIQTFQDLNADDVKGAKRIGITAGASTPKKIIQEVRRKCQSYRSLNSF